MSVQALLKNRYGSDIDLLFAEIELVSHGIKF